MTNISFRSRGRQWASELHPTSQMTIWEDTKKTFAYKPEWFNYLVIWFWFIDDIFLKWKGDIDSLTEFMDHLKKAVSSIKFTDEISTNSRNFLDTTVVMDRQGNISTDVYQKPTGTHPYLHWTSEHPPHLK